MMTRWFLLGAALAVAACGGSVSKDGAGGAGGAGGSSGSGGSSGAGGNTLCCSTKYDCYEPGGPDDGPPQPINCVSGVCLAMPPSDRCWIDSDCQFGLCTGASVCACGLDCHQEDELGWCMAPTGGCCQQDFDCGDESYTPCVDGVCKVPVLDACWSDAECPKGKSCAGASVCPCLAMCESEDKPGACI